MRHKIKAKIFFEEKGKKTLKLSILPITFSWLG